MKRWLALLAGVLLVAVALVALNRRPGAVPTQTPPSDAAVPVTVARARTTTLQEEVRASGSVQADRTVEVSSKLPGRVIAVFVREGDRVRRGQVVLGLDPADAEIQLEQARASLRAALARVPQAEVAVSLQEEATEAQLRQARAQVEAAQAQVRSADANREALASNLQAVQANLRAADSNVHAAESNLERARSDLGRLETLYAAGAVAAQQVEAARTQVAAAEASLAQARAQQAALAAQVETLTQQLAAADAARRGARANLKSIRAALQAAEANRRQVDLRRQDVAQARAAVDQARAAVSLAELQLANTVIRAPMDGVVVQRRVEPGTWAPPGVPLLVLADLDRVKIALEVSEREIARVRPGQPVVVTVDALFGRVFRGRVTRRSEVASSRTRTFTVEVELPNPDGALRPGMFGRGTIAVTTAAGAVVVPQEAVVTESATPFVWVVEAGRARRRSVRLGLRQGGLVQVLGVRPGEAVVVFGSSRLRDGVAVSVQP